MNITKKIKEQGNQAGVLLAEAIDNTVELGDIGTLSLSVTGHKLSDEQNKIVTDFLKDDTKRWLTFNVKLSREESLTVTIDKLQKQVMDPDLSFISFYTYSGEYRLLNFNSYVSPDGATYSSTISVYRIQAEEILE